MSFGIEKIRRVTPQHSDALGVKNIDSTILPEFEFHHGHVEKAINTIKDIEDHIIPIYNIPENVSQCILFTSTFEDPLLNPTISKKVELARPLLRGFSDSITRGDSIIYAEIPYASRKYYYLGPLNTTNNPNFTPDDIYNSTTHWSSKDLTEGYNINYKIFTDFNKVSKYKSHTLDRPFDIGLGEIGSDVELDSNITDLVLEGRHGNCIRFGTRFINPYTIIANNNGANLEKANNGSIIGLLSFGQISDYFPDFTNLSSNKVILKGYETDESGYKGFSICAGNDKMGGVDDTSIGSEDRFHVAYGDPKPTPEEQTEFDQAIMFSDRITFDAQRNDFTVSAFRNINFGAGKNFTLTNKGFTVLESKNIYIGKEAKKRTEPMVLGNELKKLLMDIMKVLNKAHALVQGVAIPLVDSGMTPLNLPLGPIDNIIKELEREYDANLSDEGFPISDRVTDSGPKFFSKHHFIEPNRS